MFTNSYFANQEYFMLVTGLIFLRHAYSRFLKMHDEIILKLPSRGDITRMPTRENVWRHGSIYLRPETQVDMLFSLPDGESAGPALINACHGGARRA